MKQRLKRIDLDVFTGELIMNIKLRIEQQRRFSYSTKQFNGTYAF